MIPPFCHLHVHSEYSPMRGVSSLAALCRSAGQDGFSAMALTDTNGLYGAIRFIEEAKQQGLRPILGAELTADNHRAVLLAKTPAGYASLCRLLSERHCDPSFDFIQAVARYRDGLIVPTEREVALRPPPSASRPAPNLQFSPSPAMHRNDRARPRHSLPCVAPKRA